MAALKTYSMALRSDLRGWEPKTIRAQTALKFGQGKLVAVKDEYEVLDDPASPYPAITKGWIEVPKESRKLLPQRNGVDFKVYVPSGVDWKDLPKDPTFLLSVKVQLDLSQAIGSAMSSLGLGGFASMVPSEVGLIAGSCRVKLDVPECRVTIEKVRWKPIKDLDLLEILTFDQLADLYSRGGVLEVPVEAKAEQISGSTSLSFQKGVRVCDLTARLRWMGDMIEGTYQDDAEKKALRFRIPKALDPTAGAADVRTDGAYPAHSSGG